MHDLRWDAGAYVAEFGTAHELERAVVILQEKGYTGLETWSPIPLAGMFCAGEIGPVGGQNFLHGFTASLALFD